MDETPTKLNHSFDVRSRGLWALALATSIVFASGNVPAQVPGSFVGLDKLAHFGVFGLLATLLLRTGILWRRSGWRGWLAVGIVSVFGATDEWHQSFTPGRSVEYADWIADTAGAALAVALYLRWHWYRRLLETPLRLGRRNPVSARAVTPTATPAAIGRE